MKRVILRAVLCLMVCVLCFTGCTNQEEGFTDERFINSQMDLYVEMFQASVLEKQGENLLISPLSVQVALALAANGAAGETRAEMEAVLGGDMALEELNHYLRSYINILPSKEGYKLKLANSIWMRNNGDIEFKRDFLKVNEDYYGAQSYKVPFDSQTVEDINDWVKRHTDGVIDSIVEQINADTMMYLISAVYFDAEWLEQYPEVNVQEGIFTAVSGEKRTVEMMHSIENKYIRGRNVTGIIKDYAGGQYSFAVLLPSQNIDIYDYIAQLDGQSLLEIFKNVQDSPVQASTPKFSCTFDMNMKDVLMEMGMQSAFSDKADFSNMAEVTAGELSINNVQHKTYISVAEQGTVAGAVSSVEMTSGSKPQTSPLVIQFDRPFVFMIIDNSSYLPLFMGVLADTQG